jgi:N-acetylneuraminic acid mutarotase
MTHRLLLGLAVGAGWALAGCSNDLTEPNAAPTSAPTSSPQAAVASNTFITRRALPVYWTGVVTAMIPDSAGGSTLYAIGGANENRSCIGRVRAYNVTTNTWTSKTNLPAALCGINGAGVIDGKIYVAGGEKSTARRPLSAALYVYDPATNAWTQKRSMPAAGSSGLAGVIKGKLYVVTATAAGPRFFRYDPAVNTWTTLPATDYWWLGGGGGIINNKLYLMAQAIKVYDPSTNTWTNKGSLPGDLHGLSAVVNSRLYIFGADTRTGFERPGIFIYDPVTNAWTRKELTTTLQDDYNITGAHRVLLNAHPRVEILGGGPPGNNLQYIP